MSACKLVYQTCLVVLVGGIGAESRGGDFEQFLKPLLVQKCIKCHGENKVNGEINLTLVTTEDQLLEQPELIEQLYDAIASDSMPPEDEPRLEQQTQKKLLAQLKMMLVQSVSGREVQQVQVRRLNRSN